MMADIGWYRKISSENNLTPRCPFASVHRCPRYYQSISLLGEAGRTTRMRPRSDRRLLRRWRRTEFWPTISEQETAVSSSGGPSSAYYHFCPEVSYDSLGVFADFVADFVDEIDRENAYRKLKQDHVPNDDWRWRYMSVQPLHYSECYLYSRLREHDIGQEDIFELKPNFHGIGINFRALWRRIRSAQRLG